MDAHTSTLFRTPAILFEPSLGKVFEAQLLKKARPTCPGTDTVGQRMTTFLLVISRYAVGVTEDSGLTTMIPKHQTRNVLIAYSSDECYCRNDSDKISFATDPAQPLA